MVPLVPKDPEHAVQIPVHYPHGGAGSGGEGIGLHPCQCVELRIGGAPRKARNHHIPGEGVGIFLQGVEVWQGILLPDKGWVVREVGESLVHHHHKMDPFSAARGLPLVPGGGLSAAEPLGPVYREGGKLVKEVIGKAVFVEHSGQVIGVGGADAVIQAGGPQHRDREQNQHAQAGGGAQQAPPPTPQPLRRKGLDAHKDAQDRQDRRGRQHQDNGCHRIADFVISDGAEYLFEQRQVPGKHRLVPHLNLHPVGDREAAHQQIRQRRAEKHIAQQERQPQQKQSHRQGIQGNENRFLQKIGDNAPKGVGLAPQGQQRDNPTQQYRRQQAERQRELNFRRACFQNGNSFP